MKRTFFSFFLFVYVLSAVAQSLSIGQYNIRFDKKQDREEGNGWDVRAPKIYSLINYKGWDIFGAQEVLYNQINDLKANIEGYDYIGVGRDDGAKKGEFAPIFYKKERLRCIKNGNFWLSETPDSVGSRGWDAALCRICTWGEFEDKSSKWHFFAFNLHMDHVGKVARCESAKLVLKKIKEICGEAPYIVTGDFNVDQNDSIYNILTNSKMLIDSYTIAKHRMCETGSMNFFNPEYKTDSRIDHIFLSPHFKVHKFGLHTYNYWQPIETEGRTLHKLRSLSDHYPIDAVVELPQD